MNDTTQYQYVVLGDALLSVCETSPVPPPEASESIIVPAEQLVPGFDVARHSSNPNSSSELSMNSIETDEDAAPVMLMEDGEAGGSPASVYEVMTR